MNILTKSSTRIHFNDQEHAIVNFSHKNTKENFWINYKKMDFFVNLLPLTCKNNIQIPLAYLSQFAYLSYAEHVVLRQFDGVIQPLPTNWLIRKFTKLLFWLDTQH